MTLNRPLRNCEHDHQSLLNGLNHPGGHLRGGVPVVSADRAPAEVAATAAGLVAHQFVNHPGRNAGVLQPGRVGVAEVVGTVQVDRIQEGITGDRQRRPPAGQLVLVVVVDGGQAGGVQQDAPGRRSQRGRRVGQLGQGVVVVRWRSWRDSTLRMPRGTPSPPPQGPVNTRSSGDEHEAWLSLVRVAERLPAVLGAQLERDAGLNFFEYTVMAMRPSSPPGPLA